MTLRKTRAIAKSYKIFDRRKINRPICKRQRRLQCITLQCRGLQLTAFKALVFDIEMDLKCTTDYGITVDIIAGASNVEML